MGPTTEVVRQFVGKAVRLGFDALDHWNQTYNRRAVENEIKKLDAAPSRSSPSTPWRPAAQHEDKAVVRA